MKAPDAYIFDLDGTLADTLDGIVHSLNTTLAEHGLPTHEREAFRAFVGDGVTKLVERALPDDQQHRLDEVLADYAPRLESEGTERSRAFAGVTEVLDALVSRGVPFAVLSNKPHAATVDVVERLFGGYAFVAVQGAGEDFPLKPDPTAALHLAKMLGVSPADCAYVGDSDVDMLTARNAGMIPIGAAYGMRGEAELRATGAEVILEKPIDLLTCLDEQT